MNCDTGPIENFNDHLNILYEITIDWVYHIEE